MAIIRCAILCCTFIFSISVGHANCNTNIPGHYEGRYIDNSDGTVKDQMTGLTWSKCLMGMIWDISKQTCVGPLIPGTDIEERVSSLNWQDTLLKVVELNSTEGYAQYRDWRLPNIKELASIMELACLDDGNNIAMDNTYFLNHSLFKREQGEAPSIAADFWSSTPHRRVQPSETDSTVINQAWKLGVRFGGELGARPSPITSDIYARLVRGPN